MMTFAWANRTSDLSCPDLSPAQGPSHLHVELYLRVVHAIGIADDSTAFLDIPNTVYSWQLFSA